MLGGFYVEVFVPLSSAELQSQQYQNYLASGNAAYYNFDGSRKDISMPAPNPNDAPSASGTGAGSSAWGLSFSPSSSPSDYSWLAPVAASALSFFGGERQNRANQREAEINRDFQADMSGTAYQRAMLDMRRAGLNPILASRVGGASTPSGAMATYQNTLAPAVSSALEASAIQSQNRLRSSQSIQSQAQTGLIEQQTDHVKEQIKQTIENTELISRQQGLTTGQAARVGNESFRIYEDALRLQQQTKGLKLDNALKSVLTRFYDSNRPVLIGKDLGVSPKLITDIIGSGFGAPAKFVKSFIKR